MQEKQKEPYMKHLVPGILCSSLSVVAGLSPLMCPALPFSHFLGADIADIHFTPYEDVMGIGHSLGVSSIIVPGSGEPNFDSFEANPYQTNKQLREATVHSLLEKVIPRTTAPFKMASLTPSFSA